MIIFGPIPSRRLGRSLGINNIPPKVCTYSCIYCQIGATDTMTIKRREFYSPTEIFNEVSEKINQLQKTEEKIDYLTFVPDGEPTLDINLGKSILLLKKLGIKIAVITNASLLWDRDVRNDLMNADWVSVKIDSIDEKIWGAIDRPHGLLKLSKIIEGIENFSLSFKGELVTETMLVKDCNDSIESLTNTAKIIKAINPAQAYILVPTRPPAEPNLEVPSEESLNNAYQIYSSVLKHVEIISNNEGTDFSYSCDAEEELLSILAVHPMRKDSVEIFLDKANTKWNLIDGLIDKGILKEVKYFDEIFLIKNIKSKLEQNRN
ncbi:MAG: radical SAM protein [Melioribacteraceae bacterium]|nr:radical SAM protein [Melioribacteraceae bacterium]